MQFGGHATNLVLVRIGPESISEFSSNTLAEFDAIVKIKMNIGENYQDNQDNRSAVRQDMLVLSVAVGPGTLVPQNLGETCFREVKRDLLLHHPQHL